MCLNFEKSVKPVFGGAGYLLISPKPQTTVTALVAAMAAVLYLCLAALPVHAAEGFDFYTDSPGIHASPMAASSS